MNYGPKRGMKKPRGRKAKQAMRERARARSSLAADGSRASLLRLAMSETVSRGGAAVIAAIKADPAGWMRANTTEY